MHSPASASALVEARPGIGISAFRRFLPAVSTQTFARNLAVFVMFLSLFELYKFSTLLHRSTFVFSAFRALPPFFFKFSRLLHTHHDLFRKLHSGWLAGPNVAKCRQMHFCFATTGADTDVQEPRDHVRRNQRLNRPFQSSFLFSIFHFFVFFLRAFGYDPQERFFSSAFPGRSGHRGPSRFFLADCSLRSFVRAGLGNMLFRRARWVVVTARV